MCKDYMSLEMASFIGRLRVFAPQKLFYYPQPRADGSQRSSERKEVKKTEKKKFYKDIRNIYLSVYTHALRGRSCIFKIWMIEILKCGACWR